jgi:hypothetical protein
LRGEQNEWELNAPKWVERLAREDGDQRQADRNAVANIGDALWFAAPLADAWLPTPSATATDDLASLSQPLTLTHSRPS